MAHHDIKVRVIDGQAIPAIPPPGFMRKGDTVSYSSEDGEVTVLFEVPFSNAGDAIQHGQTRALRQSGIFFGKCFVTRPDGTEVGWSPDQPGSGGEHDVRP